MTIEERVRNTPKSDWPVADRELSGPGKFFGLYGGEHIAATEFVIGATLAQYGCSTFDILVGLAIGNLLATLCFALLCAPIGVKTRLTLYSYLGKVIGSKGQKIYNVFFGIGYAAIGALGISISATAIRRIFNVPVQHEWYPTDFRFVLIVLILGAVVVIVAANGFNGVSKFATLCVPWMIVLFVLGIICVLPQLVDVAGFGAVNSPMDLYRLLDQHIWVVPETGNATGLGMGHVIAFAIVCNLALHIGLNDMSVFRYAKSSKYGYISAMGMFVGHYFAWISAAIMGATAAALLNSELSLLDSGEVAFAVLGYIGLLGVVIAGWTTANPVIYRVALSFNTLFPKESYKKMTYIMGSIIVVLACFPVVQRAAEVINYTGLMVIGMGAVCVAEYYIFPKIGYTQYWNLYKKSDLNWAAMIAWGISLAFFVVMLFTNALQQNFWFIPTYLLALVSYIILAGCMGAKKKYPEQEREQFAYEAALRDYVNNQEPEAAPKEQSRIFKVFKNIRYVVLAVMIITGGVFWTGSMSVEMMKNIEGILTLVYFVFTVAAFIAERKENNA